MDAELTTKPSPRGSEHRIEQRTPAPENVAAKGKTTRHEAPPVPEESREAEAQTLPATDMVSPTGHPDPSKFGSSLITEELPAASVPPIETTSSKRVHLFQRMSRRTKIVLGAVPLLVVIAVIVAVVVNGESQSSRESRLFAKLPIRYNRSDCASYTAGSSELAELKCADQTTTPSVDAFYGLYANHADLVNEFKGFVDQRISNLWNNRLEPCLGRAQSPTSWERAGSGGSVACLSDSQGRPDGVIWTLDSSLVMGWTFGADSVPWWQTHFG